MTAELPGDWYPWPVAVAHRWREIATAPFRIVELDKENTQ